MHQATVAAFLNQKGGVGKTTSVVNIGCGLAILGQKVLIVDLDPQGHLSAFLGINTDSLETTIYDVLRARVAPKDAIITQQLGARLTIDGQDSTLSIGIIPSNLDLAEAESGLALTPDREILLRKAIGTLGADFDYILIDCPPSLGLLSTNALVASKKVFVPVQTEYLAFESLENLLKTIETVMARRNPELQIGGLIATRYDRRKVINRTVVESLKERFGVLLMGTMIRENIALAESPSFGKDIFTYRPRSYGAEDYLNLCLEMLGRATTTEALFTVERRGGITMNTQAQVAS